MGALTTRLSLYKPGGGLTGTIVPDETADIDKINSNMDLLDAAMGAPRFGSTTRPASPFDGKIIYENDTGALVVYDQGSALWRYPNQIQNVADLNALGAATFEGRRTHVDSMNVDFQVVDNAWVQQGVASFATAAARDTEYAKASGAYKVQGAQALTTDLNVTWAYYTAFNASTNKGGALAAGWYPASGNVPALKVVKNIAQNGTTAAVPISWASSAAGVPHDPWGLYSTGSTGVIATIQTDGRYRVTVLVSTSGVPSRTVSLLQNGSTVATGANTGAAGAASGVEIVANLELTAGDVISATVVDTAAGSSVNITTTMAIVEWLGPRTAL